MTHIDFSWIVIWVVANLAKNQLGPDTPDTLMD